MRHLPATLILACTSACALSPAVRTSGPAVSKEGVRVAVVGQHCDGSTEPDYPTDVVDLTLALRVTNATPEAALVQTARLGLMAAEATKSAIEVSNADAQFVLAPGTERTFEIRFKTRELLRCSQAMRLDLARAVSIDGQTVDLGVITFVPRDV